jgi:hypothetical protein
MEKILQKGDKIQIEKASLQKYEFKILNSHPEDGSSTLFKISEQTYDPTQCSNPVDYHLSNYYHECLKMYNNMLYKY